MVVEDTLVRNLVSLGGSDSVAASNSVLLLHGFCNALGDAQLQHGDGYAITDGSGLAKDIRMVLGLLPKADVEATRAALDAFSEAVANKETRPLSQISVFLEDLHCWQVDCRPLLCQPTQARTLHASLRLAALLVTSAISKRWRCSSIKPLAR